MKKYTRPRKKDLIYHYAVNHYYANEIKDFKDINCSKAYVSKVLKQLVKEGYIEPIKKSYKKQNKFVRYRKTDKIYSVKLTKSMSGASKTKIIGPRLNLLSIKYDFKSLPKKKVPGHSYLLNNTKIIDYKHSFDEDLINFRVIGDKWLVVFMPEHLVSADHFRHTRNYLYSKAEKYADWFMEYFDCVLGEPSTYQDYEIAVEDKDPFLSDFAKKHGMLKIINAQGQVVSWYDFSKGYLEFETKDEDLAEIKAFMPMIVADLQNRVLGMQQDIDRHDSLLNVLNEKIDKVDNILQEMKGLLKPKVIPVDEKRDVT